MFKNKLEFTGNDTYSINTTGDSVTGDHVCFERAIFSGTYKRPKFEGYELVEAVIIKESYGKQSGQHTFTLQDSSGNTFLIKGRNLYRNGLWRKPWDDENARKLVAEEKHKRGKISRLGIRRERESIGIY